MIIIKPAHVLHNDDKERPLSIFTVSIHPDGSRLASGGLDTKIKIWSTNPILNREAELDETVPKLLCTMTSHSGEFAWSERLSLLTILKFSRCCYVC